MFGYFYITENDTDNCSEKGCSEGCVELPWSQMSIYSCIFYDISTLQRMIQTIVLEVAVVRAV